MADRQIPPPSNWQDLESLCADLWARIWADPATQRNGRQGQRQQGVDVYGRPGQGAAWAGVQCKAKSLGAALTRDEVMEEVNRAKSFRPPLAELIVATTARRDARIQELARLITEENLALGLFAVQVVFWDDILAHLAKYPDLLRVHCGIFEPAAIPAQAPPLPSHYVARLAETEHLLRRLCAAGGSQVLAVGALHGQGGIGKTTLAAAVARSPRTFERFGDGVLWATLGQQPDLLSELSKWIQGLGDHTFRPSSVAAAAAYLRSLLYGKAVLLVIDDAWSSEHVRPFLAGGERARALVTTRRVDVADEIGAELLRLGSMRSGQALALFASSLGRELAPSEAEDALALADAAGFLPLALELAAARVRRGVSWRMLREALEQEVARLEELESARRRRGGPARLEASLNLSLEALRAEDEEAWRCFVALGVMPEDAVVAAPMAATLWRSPVTAAEEVLELLWSDALLLPAPPVLAGGRSWRGYRLHDLLHHVARRRLTDPPPRGMGSTLEAAHASLVEAYRANCREGRWQNLRNDGYVHARLGWHLERAGRADELHLLLREETPTGNAWFEARQSEGQVAGYLADVDRAWSLCEAEPRPAVAVALGRQCFYAGVLASFVSFAANVPPALLLALVRQGIWTPSQALAYARQAPPEKRATALARLVPLLPGALLAEVLPSAQALDPESQATVLAGLARRADEALLERILAQARALGDDAARAKALLPVLVRLPDRLLSEGLAAIAESRDPSLRLFGLLTLLARVPDELLGAVLALLAGEEDAETRALVIREIAARLPPDLRTVAAELAAKIEDKSWKGVALFAVAAGSLDAAALKEAADDQQPWGSLAERCDLPGLAAAAGELEDVHRATGILAFPLVRWFERLAAAKLGELQRQMGLEPPPLPESLVEEEIAGVLLPRIPADLLLPCLGVLCARLESLAADLLPALFPHLSAAGQAVILELMSELDDDPRSFRLLLALRPFVEEKERSRILRILLAAGPPAEILLELLPSLSGRLLDLVFEAGFEGQPTPHRAAGRAPRINLLQASEVLLAAHEEPEEEDEEDDPWGALSGPLGDVVRSLQEENLRTKILDRLSARIPSELLSTSRRRVVERGRAERKEPLTQVAGRWAEALEEIGGLEPESLRAAALACVTPHLPEEHREEALTLALGLSESAARAEILPVLVPLLPAPLLVRALDVAPRWGARHLVAFLAQAAPFFPPEIAREALVRVEEAGDAPLTLQTVEVLLPRLSIEDLREVPSLCHRLGPSGRLLLRRALPQLPEDVRTLALQSILADLGELSAQARRRELGELLVSAPASLLATILRWVLDSRETGLIEDFEALAPRLPESALSVALTVVHRERDGLRRAGALLALIPFLVEEDESMAVLEVVRISSLLKAEGRAGLLFSLASRLRGATAGSVLQQALTAARTCRKGEDRKSLLLLAVARLVSLWHEPERRSSATALVPHPLELWNLVLEGAAALEAPARREILEQAAAGLPGEQLARAWELALEDWSEDRLAVLKALARRLGELPDEQMVRAVWFPGTGHERSEVLAALPPDRLRILIRSLKGRPSGRRRLLALIDASARRAAAAGSEHLLELLELSATVDDMSVLATAFWWIAQHVPEGAGTGIMTQALETLALVRDDVLRTGMLLRMCAHAPDRLKDDFAARAADFEDERDRAAYLAELASRWPETVFALLTGPASLDLGGPARTAVLCKLGLHLPPSGLQVLLGEVRGLDLEEDRLAVLAALGPRLSGDLWEEAFAQVRGLSGEALRTRGLAALSSSAPFHFLSELLEEACGLPGDLRLLVLHSLIPRFLVDDLPFEQLVGRALELGEGGLWVKVLAPAAAAVPAARRERASHAFEKLPAGRERDMVFASLRLDAAPPPDVAVQPSVGLDLPAALPEVCLRLSPQGRVSDLRYLLQVVNAARSAGHLLGDHKGALLLLEHAAALSPPGAARGELAAGLTEVWALSEQRSLPFSPAPGEPLVLRSGSARGRLLTVGQAAFDRGWYLAAIKVWSKILLSDPDDSEAKERIGLAEEILARWRAAGPGPSKIVMSRGVPVESKRRRLLEAGQDAFDHGRFQEAIDTWSYLFLIDVDDVEAAEAIEAARKCLAGDRPEQVTREQWNILVSFNRALQELARGHLEEAGKLCETILENEPKLTPASDLLRHVEHALRIQARVSEAREVAGRGWSATARVAWERVLELDPSHAEALERLPRAALLAANKAERFRDLVSRALSLLDAGASRVALDLWIEASVIDLDPDEDHDLREMGAQRFDPLCRERVAGLLAEARLRLDREELEAAVGLAAEALRLGHGQEEAFDLVRKARHLRDARLEHRAEEIRDEVLKALGQEDLEGAIAVMPELCSLADTVPLARTFARDLGNRIRAEQWRAQARTELARFQEDRLRGDRSAALETCARIFDADPSQPLAGWALQLSRGFPFDPWLLFWPPVAAPRDPKTETLIVLLTLALEDRDPETLALFVRGQAELDRGETEAAVASWRTARNGGFEPSWQLFTAEWQLQAAGKRPGPDEIRDILSLLDQPPPAWSEEGGAWARTPEDFVMHLARILPWIPDSWVVSLVPPVLALPSAYLLTEALSRLASRLATLPLETLRPWWNETLRSLSALPRPRYLAALALFLPVLARVAGEEAGLEVAGAIRSLARGWP